MNQRIFAAIIFILAMPASVFAQIAKADTSTLPERRLVPYTIDTSTIGNWDTLNVGGEFTDITGAATGSVEMILPTTAEPIVYISLLKDDVSKSGGGEDVLVLGRKDTLEFSAANTARAELTRFLVLFMVTREETLLAYDTFPEHPKFTDLVTLYTKQKGDPKDTIALEKIGTLEGEILLDVMTQIRTRPITQ